MDIHNLLNWVCKSCNIKKEDVIGTARNREIVKVRVLFSYLASLHNYTLSETGRAINKDHSTIIYYLNSSTYLQWAKEEARISGWDVIENSESKGGGKKNDGNVSKVRPNSRYGKYRNLFARAGHVCEVPTCNFDEVLEIHHIIPRSKGGSNDVSNLIILCPNHHSLADQGRLYIKGKLE